MAADLRLQAIVARLASLGLSKYEIQFFTRDWTHYPDDPLDTIHAANFVSSFESTSVFKASVDVQDVNDPGVITFSVVRADGGWSGAGNEASFVGSPNRVRVSVNIFSAKAVNGGRPAPAVNLLKNGLVVGSSRTGYVRDANGHAASSNSFSFLDDSPGVDPVYSLESFRGSTIWAAQNSVVGSSFSLEAVV